MTKRRNSTTSAGLVRSYEETAPQLYALQTEVRDLAKKKPDATFSKSKVALINRVLADIKENFKDESGGKYLELLDDETLPQYSDAVLIIAQFAAVLTQFKKRYYGWDEDEGEGWFTR